MLFNPVKIFKGGTGLELQSLIFKSLSEGLSEIEVLGDWIVSTPIIIISRKHFDRIKIKGKNARILNNVENGVLFNFISTFSTIWERIDIEDFVITSIETPINSDMIHISGGCFGGTIKNCYIGGESGDKLINGTILKFKSNHEDFGLTKNFEIDGCKFWYAKEYGIVSESENSTPAYITVKNSDIEMCNLGAIVGGYENLTIEKSIIAYNGKTNNFGGINLYGTISYARNLTIKECGFEHNQGSHINLDRITNCEISKNTMIGLSDGVNGIDSNKAINCDGNFGVLYIDISNNRIESIKEGYVGIKLNNKVIVARDSLNQFVFSNGTSRQYDTNIKVTGIKEDGTKF